MLVLKMETDLFFFTLRGR